MKKALITLLAGAMIFTFASCGNTSNSTASSSSQPPEIKTYFGKVSSVTGNEIDIDLAKEPEMEKAPSQEPDAEGGMAAATMTPATPAGGTQGAAQRVEVEYTGNIKSITIPAGIKPKNAIGDEKQLSDIKKGSIVNIFTDASDNVTEVFIYD
ncbi:MAG: hypothetical protein RR573_07300 [Oscillospiraceae bacterium]